MRHPVFDLSDRLVEGFASHRPLTATAFGIDGFDDRLDDRSPGGVAALAELLRGTRDELASLPPATDRDSRLAVRVLGSFLEDRLELIERGAHRTDIAHIASSVADVREGIDGQDRSTPQGWRNVASRLRAMDDFIGGWRESVAEGLARGDLVAARQVRSVMGQLRASVAPTGTFCVLVAEYDGDDAGLADDLREGLEVTRRANLEAADWLERDYLPTAPEEDGVGRERYAVEAASHLGREIDLDATYAWGWDVVHELRDRMVSVAREIAPDADLRGVVERLRTDPAAAAGTPAAFVDEMLERQRVAIDRLSGTHFHVPDEIRAVDVRLAAPGSPLGAWYRSPSEDLSRPGQIWWALGERIPFPLWDQVSTAYHEGFPGHHLQVALGITMRERLSRLHRSIQWKSGTGEGWALYAERLMDELGFLDAPMYVLGYLASSMLRACRVVIDIGCHLGLSIPEDARFHPGERWSHALAVEMLTDLAFLDPDYAESEATRYLGYPGQAITYKIGEHAILDLREERRGRQGDAFSLQRFHADVLAAGAVGLDLLAEVVRGELDGDA
ncbi:MAG: DUF885 domain-containing protein [Actinobacteria bacterium]|nr:DUF885 domain-containing protein [Actinomycetota bacterium]